MQTNIQRHLNEAKDQAAKLFAHVDTNGDGIVNIKEYEAYFLVSHDLIDSEHATIHAEKHATNVDQNSEQLEVGAYMATITFNAARMQLEEEKAKFKSADADDNGLDDIEWLGFQVCYHLAIVEYSLALCSIQNYLERCLMR